MTGNLILLVFLLVAGIGRAEAACGPNEFACASHDQCIPDDYVCDEIEDCDDNSDEEPTIDDCQAYLERQEEVESSFTAVSHDDEDDDEQAPVEKEPPQQCALRKCEVGSKFKLVDGLTHYYTYETKSVTVVAGSSPSNTSLAIRAQLAFTVLTACELELQVHDMVVETTRSDSGGQLESVEDNAFIAAVTKNPLRFAYHDGLVEEMCPLPDEDPNALNFKRAAVSLLQNTMPRLDLDHHTTETDVVGHCKVDYQVAGVAGKGLVLKKTRDIPSCTTRSSTTSFIKGVEYDFVGGIHTPPLLDTTSECVQVVAEGRIESARCQELHRLTPFSSERGGIFTTITQTLNFTHKSYSSSTMGSVHGRTNLLYDYHNHVHAEGNPTDGVDDAHFWGSLSNQILDKIAENMENEGVGTNAPRLFLELVQALRHLSFQELWGINEERNWGPERIVFDDALPMLGTGGSVGVMRDLMGQDHNNILTNTWLTSLSFISRPDLDTILEAAPLLEMERVHADAFLGVGSLVQAYCRDHPFCTQAQPILRIMDTLHQFIRNSCHRETKQDKIQVLMAMKGIGNAGAAVTEGIPGSLAQCFFNEQNENEIRLGAITAFRRFPCEVSRAPLQRLFQDHTQDAELRIAAYLELMRCPDFQVVKVVKQTLLNEEVNQVGSFVWTHLENLKETSMPSRAHLQGLISNEDIASKFTADVRKFSRNIELSGFYDQLNVGGNMDANVVFSQESYIPRSATFNFTTDLFGHSLNLLEIGARIEGWDRELDSMFFRSPSTPDSEPALSNPKLRDVMSRTQKKDKYMQKDAEVSFHMKTFGNEIYYRHLHGIQEVVQALGTLNPAERIRRLNMGEDINLQKSWLATESAYIIPTTAGLPLNLSITASVALNVHASGKIDVFNLLQGRGGISGRLKPSVGVEVVGSMLVDGHVAQSGAQLVSTLHSSTVVEGRFDINGSELVRVDLAMPRDKIDIMNISSSLVLIHGSAEAAVQHSRESLDGVTSDRMELTGCSAYQDKLGAKLCWNVQYPNASRVPESPFFPLTGPAQLQLALHKTDPTLTTYQIRYTWERRRLYRTFLLSVNTPGTAIPREHSISYNINFGSQNIYLDLHSPQTNISARGRYVDSRRERRADLSVELNGREVATLTAGLAAHSRQGRDVIRPIFTVTYQGQDAIRVTGVVDRRQNRKTELMEVDMQVKCLLPQEDGRWVMAAGTIKGDLSLSEGEWTGGLEALYSPSESAATESISLEYRWTKSLSASSDIKTELSVRFFFSQFPNINFKGQLLRRVHFGTRENSLQLNFGENFEDINHRVDIYEAFTYHNTETATIFNFTTSIKQRLRNLDLKFGTDWYRDKYVHNTGILIQYDTNHRIESRLHMKWKPLGLVDTEGSWFLKIPGRVDWEVNGHIKENIVKKYTFEVEIKAGHNWRLEASGTYSDHSTLLEQLHNLQLDLHLPSYGLTRINMTIHSNNHRMSLDTHVLLNDGRKYEVRIAYERRLDHMQAQEHILHFELHMPNQLYILNSAISFGTVITFTSELHLDRQRDIHLSVTADILQPRKTGLQVLLKWNANRDPNQKMTIEMLYVNPNDRVSNFTLNGLLFFLGQQYRVNWMTERRFEYMERDMIWENRNEGSFSWMEQSGHLQEIAANVTMRFRRGNTAELYGMFDLDTPFLHWKKNYLELKYFRNANQIESKLKARWHDGEFIDLQLTAQKHIQDSNFRIETRLDVNSSFEGLVYASTEVWIEKKLGVIDLNFYIQWDKDRLEVTLEGKDDSSEAETRFSLFGQILTTIEGYREISSAVDFIIGPSSTDIHATAKWEGHFYKITMSGTMYNGLEYLRIGVDVEADHHEEPLVTASFRVYHDPETLEEKLSIVLKWLEEEVLVDGQVVTLPHRFKAGIEVESTFEELERAVIVLGFTKDTVMKTEAKLQWNDNVDAGFELLGQVTSLTDFFISCTIHTPFSGMKIIKGELRNLFQLQPQVHVQPRIYGQLGDKKYGLGARYEQGQLPRLRVALELYTPLPELHTVFLDLCDNSTVSDVKYGLVMKYGPTKHLRIDVDLKEKTGGMEGQAVAALPLQSLGEDLEDATLEASGSFLWVPEPKLELTLLSRSSSLTKVEVKASFKQEDEGKLQLTITTPVSGYENLDLAIEYCLPVNERPGHFDGRLNTSVNSEFHLKGTGTTKELEGSFVTPYAPFRNGNFMWKMTSLDVVKSRLVAKFQWENSNIALDASVKFQQRFIQMLEGTLETPWEDLGHSSIRLVGQPQEGGYKNQLVLRGMETTYRGHLFWKYRDENDWDVDIQVEPENRGRGGRYRLQVALTNLEHRPFKLALHMSTPHQGFQTFHFQLLLQRSQVPYSMTVDWDFPVGAGTIEIDITELSFDKVEGKTSLVLRKQPGSHTSYMVDLNLSSGPSQDLIDVGGSVEFKSNHEYWDQLVLRGKVRQITNDPGELSLYLMWPRLDPITFIARAEHQNTGHLLIIKPLISLNLTSAHYSFNGEMLREGQYLNLTGVLDWKREFSGPQQVLLYSSLVFNEGNVNGHLTLSLPMVEGWQDNKADLFYETREGRHWFRSSIVTGSEVTTVTGNMLAQGFPATEGTINVTSTLKWENQPLTFNFKQDLNDIGYNGDYYLEWPTRMNNTSPWKRSPIQASLRHRFLEAGHGGTFKITYKRIMKKPIEIDYGFKFPATGDVTVELGATYQRIKVKVKVDRVTAVVAENVIKQRTSFEFSNPLWPFGVASTKETNTKSSTELETVTTLELYDLHDVSRRITITLIRNTAQSKRNSVIKVKSFGREIFINMGYDLTPGNFCINFLLSWAEDRKIEFDISWTDVSKGFSKEQILKGKFSQPFRTVLLDGYYMHNNKNVTAFIKFNWDGMNPSEEVVMGQLQWTDESTKNKMIHKTLVSLSHPLLEKNIKVWGELQQDDLEELTIEGQMEYSSDPLKNLKLEMIMLKDKTRNDAVVINERAVLMHPATNLTLKTNGSLEVNRIKCALQQDFMYTNYSGHPYRAHLITGVDLLQKTLQITLETWTKLVDVLVEVEQQREDQWIVSTTSYPGQETPLLTSVEFHPSHQVITITFDNLLTSNTTYETDFPRYIAEQVVVEGGLEDLRNARFSMKHLQPSWVNDGQQWQQQEQQEQEQPPLWVQDANFYFRLNNSRLLTSRFDWRPEIKQEFLNEIGEFIGASHDLRRNAEEWLQAMLKKIGEECLSRAKPIVEDLVQHTKPIIIDFKDESEEFVSDMWQLYNSINSTAMELRVRESVQFVIPTILQSLQEIPLFQELKTKLARGELKGQLSRFLRKLQDFIQGVFSDVEGPGLKEKLKTLFIMLAERYDQYAKRLYLQARESIEAFTHRLAEWFYVKWQAVYNNYKPHILRTFDDVETNAWTFAENLIGWMKRLGLEVKSSAYYQRIQELATYLEKTYKDFSEKSKRENLEEYFSMLIEKIKSGAKAFLDLVAPFMEDWGGELRKAWTTLMQFRTARTVKEVVVAAVNKVIWTVQYVNISGQVIDAMAFFLEHGWTIVTQTGVEASQKYIKAKTMFRCTPEKGELELVQKLPLDWHAFNHKPSWQDLPEYSQIVKMFSFFSSSSNTTLFKIWHKMVKLRFSPSSLFPPFTATGYMIGEQHFITFDQQHLEYKGRCQHLLVADMVGGRWAVSVNYHHHSSRTIIIYIHDSYIEIAKDFRVSVNGRATELPASVSSVSVHRSLHSLHVDSHLYGFRVNWNLAQDVTSITIHGSYFGKTGGLLGLYNYEPYDDFQFPSGELTDDGTMMAESWDVSPVHCVSTGNIARLPSKVPIEACTQLFHSKGSPLKGCFYEVDSKPYYNMCLVDYNTHAPSEQNTCTAAAAYMEACGINSIPIKIPSYCVQCKYMNDNMQLMTLEEGVPVVLEEEDILKSTDIVIILEAQHCNTILSEKKPVSRFGTFIKELNEELQNSGLHNIRYAMVVYGGEPPFSMPVVATVNNQIFTDASNINKALDHVKFMTEDYSEHIDNSYDAFVAYSFAASLNFRAGVTISFIHFPCQSCQPFLPSMEYSTMYHILLEYSVTLHVFNQDLFDIPKDREKKKLLGIDRELAYTMKDTRGSGLKGDRALKSQVSIPKDKLGYCAPLAHQTNGTIFTSANLVIPARQASRANRIKKKIQKLAIVFGRRLALTAYPREKKRCVCIPRGPDGGGIIECDNWGSGPLAILRDYGYDTEISYTPETNSGEVGSCIERGADGRCLRLMEN
ncbi:hypothetical protein O3P69_010366 [Scylla paramamosain]|uniref:Vitellogenin domain-containing protein n=1 Tax=Scylla paramamosain TaxID=85552 RepID=A0AAW0TVB7_SCYPA